MSRALSTFWRLLGFLRPYRAGTLWSLGLAGYVALIVSVYPTIRDNPDLNKLVESYPEALKAFIAFGGQFDFTSAAGYLGSELFSFMIPALFLVASVGNGAGSIAGRVPGTEASTRERGCSTGMRAKSGGSDGVANVQGPLSCDAVNQRPATR